MNINPEARLAEIEKEREALHAIIAERDKELRAEALNEVRELVGKWSFTEKEIRSKLAEPRTALEPKYRDPETGETWPGRGRTPDWLKRKIEAGAKQEDFLIAKAEDKSEAPAADEAPAAPGGEVDGAAPGEAPAGEVQDPFVTHGEISDPANAVVE